MRERSRARLLASPFTHSLVCSFIHSIFIHLHIQAHVVRSYDSPDQGEARKIREGIVAAFEDDVPDEDLKART